MKLENQILLMETKHTKIQIKAHSVCIGIEEIQNKIIQNQKVKIQNLI